MTEHSLRSDGGQLRFYMTGKLLIVLGGFPSEK